jgi:NitT/TauT family transport system substrate-binding protein
LKPRRAAPGWSIRRQRPARIRLQQRELVAGRANARHRSGRGRCRGIVDRRKGRDFGGIVAPGDSPIQNAKDLEGKTVSVNNLKNIGDTSVSAAARAMVAIHPKSNTSSCRFRVCRQRATSASMQPGSSRPFLTITKERGAKVIAWNLVDTAPDLMIAVYFTTRKFATENQDLVKAFPGGDERIAGLCRRQPHRRGAAKQFRPSRASRRAHPANSRCRGGQRR